MSVLDTTTTTKITKERQFHGGGRERERPQCNEEEMNRLEGRRKRWKTRIKNLAILSNIPLQPLISLIRSNEEGLQWEMTDSKLV